MKTALEFVFCAVTTDSRGDRMAKMRISVVSQSGHSHDKGLVFPFNSSARITQLLGLYCALFCRRTERLQWMQPVRQVSKRRLHLPRKLRRKRLLLSPYVIRGFPSYAVDHAGGGIPPPSEKGFFPKGPHLERFYGPFGRREGERSNTPYVECLEMLGNPLWSVS